MNDGTMEDGDDIYVYYFNIARTESSSLLNFLIMYENKSSFQVITKEGKGEVPIFIPCVKHGHVENW